MAVLKAENHTQKEAMMPQHDAQRRQQANARSLASDNIGDICGQMAGSKSWRYKWKEHDLADDPSRAREMTRRPGTQAAKTPDLIQPVIIARRQTLVQNGQRGDAAAIQQALQQQGIEPVPSHRTISRILQRHKKEVNSTHQRLQAGDHLRTFPGTMFRSFHPFVTVKADSIKRGRGAPCKQLLTTRITSGYP